MLKSKFPLSRSLRNDTGLVTKRLDAKRFSVPTDTQLCQYTIKNDLGTENKQQSTF